MSTLAIAPASLRRLARACGAIVVAASAAVLAAWAIGIPWVTDLSIFWISTKPNSALCLAALGISLFVSASEGGRLPHPRIALSHSLAAFAGLVGLSTFVEHAGGFDLGIDRLLFASALNADAAAGRAVRMAFLTALCIALLGAAFCLRGKDGRRSAPSLILCNTAMLLSSVSLLSIALGVHPERGFGSLPPMAILTSVCVLLLSLGRILLDPDKGLLRYLRSKGPAGMAARRLSPAALIVPIVIAALKLEGDRLGIYEPSFGVLLVAATYVVLLGALASWTVRSLERSDGVRAMAEEKVKRKDELLALTGELSKVGGWEFDATTGLGSWTEEVARIHGVDPSSDTNENFGLGFYEGESRERIEKAIADALRLSKPYDLELGLRAADGRLKRVRTIGIPILEGGRVVRVRGIFQDVTEIRRIQDELRLSEERFSKAFALSLVGQSISTLSEGTLIDVNAAYCRIIGYTREELIGKSSVDFNLFADSRDRATLVDAVSREGFAKDRHILVRTRTGSLRDTMISMTPISLEGTACLISSVVDITDRLKAEEALRESEERYRSLFENMVEGFAYCRMDYDGDEAVDFVYLSVNSAFAALTGLQGAAGRKVSELIPGIRESDPELFAAYSRVARTQVPEHFEIEVKALDMWFSITVYSSKSGYFIAVFDVITARKRAEAEIRALNADLEDRVRRRTSQLEDANAELEAFSYSVSHDLRSPLRGIDGWSAAIEEEFGPSIDSKALGYLARVRSESQRMGNLIDSLLQLAKVGRAELSREDLDLSELSQVIVARMRETYAGRSIDFSIEPSLRAFGDRKFMEIALVNLFDNACKFTAKTQGARIEFGRDASGAFYVRDNGAGFDMAYASKLFAPFQRMHKASEYPGTGIGLATVHRIVAKHGGRIWAKAAPGEGASFHFTLEDS